MRVLAPPRRKSASARRTDTEGDPASSPVRTAVPRPGLASLRIPPGNQLAALKSDRKGQHSIRINGQWRVCFVWKSDGAHRVEIVDYH